MRHFECFLNPVDIMYENLFWNFLKRDSFRGEENGWQMSSALVLHVSHFCFAYIKSLEGKVTSRTQIRFRLKKKIHAPLYTISKLDNATKLKT